MKAKIHPEYTKSTVTCACGNTWETRSTAGDIKLEICSACHPFFTGKQKLVDTAGRVEKFMAKYGMNGKNDKANAEQESAKEEKQEEKQEEKTGEQ